MTPRRKLRLEPSGRVGKPAAVGSNSGFHRFRHPGSPIETRPNEPVPQTNSRANQPGFVVSGEILPRSFRDSSESPASQPNFALHPATLYASKDPVALDSVALKQLETLRVKESFPPIGRLASYIQTATATGLGNSEPSRIEVKNVGR